MTWESQLEKRPRFVKAIGMVSIETSALEYFLAELFGHILFISTPVAQAIYLTPRSATARVDILGSKLNKSLEG